MELVGGAVPGHESKAELAAGLELAWQSETGAGRGLQTLAELLATAGEESEQLVAGMLWAGRATWAFSSPNVGKTLILIAMGLHVAGGRPFCGRAGKQGPVLLIEEDSPRSVMREYVEYLSELFDIPLEGLPFWINDTQGLRAGSDTDA